MKTDPRLINGVAVKAEILSEVRAYTSAHPNIPRWCLF